MEATLAVESTRGGPARPAKPGPPRLFRLARPWPGLAAVAVSGFLALLAWALRWRGGDLPAQLYRIGLFRARGFTLWDDQWYAGHHTVGYSLLLPVLGALLGAELLGAISAVVGAWAFDRLAHDWIGQTSPGRAMAASLWFAAGTVVNLAVGRLAFALGMALGLLALLALTRRHHGLAAGLALVTGLASPVAGAFLALAGGAHALAVWTDGGGERSRRSTPALVLGVMALFPVLLFAVFFPEGGTFPFTAGALAAVLGASVAVWWSVEERSVRWGAVLYGLVAIAVFVVATPLGGNLSRLGMMFAAPLVLCGQWRPRRWAGLALLVALLWWQWSPALDAITGGAGNDPSASPAYYTGLLAFFRQQSGPLRIEIPVTYHHWEVVDVAPTIALARGWERQLDIADNQLFYQPTLDPAAYEAWLRTNAVAYVALPDVSLDRSSLSEAALLRAGLPDLHLAWADRHWRVWQVDGALPFATGPATLVHLGIDSFVLAAGGSGLVTVRVRYTSHWEVEGMRGCIGPSADGWTLVHVLGPGTVTVHTTLTGQLLHFGDKGSQPCEAAK